MNFKIKNITLIQLLGLSFILVACIGNHEVTKQSNNENTKPSVQLHRENTKFQGMVGDYYAKPNFQDFLFSSIRKVNFFELDDEEQEMFTNRYVKNGKNHILSVRMQGHLKFDNPGNYFIELAQNGSADNLSNYQIKIMVNGKSVSHKNTIEIKDSNKLYKIKIELSGNKDIRQLKNIELLSINVDQNQTKQMNSKHLYTLLKDGETPEDTSDTAKLDIHKNALNGFIIMPLKSGNTILGGWMDADYASGYTKYFASSSDIPTTLGSASPWSDDEKIFGIAEQDGISSDAKNPIIAAYPVIKPSLVDFTITDNSNVSMSFNSDNTRGTNYSHSVSENSETNSSTTASANLSISKKPSLDISVSHTWGQSHSFGSNDEWGTSSSTSVSNGIENSFNPSEQGRLIYSIYLKNTGTAPITNFNPKLNLASVDADSKKIHTISSIPQQDGRTISFIGVNQMWPSGAPALIGEKDSFNSSPITINEDQYKRLKNPKNQVKIDIPEISEGNDENAIKWAKIVSLLPSKTTRLIFRTPHRDIERRVFANNPEGDNLNAYKQPELSLRDGLYTAFKLDDKKSSFSYQANFNDPREVDGSNYSFSKLEIIADKKTKSTLEKLNAGNSDPEKSLVNLDTIKLRPYMNFLITPTGWITNNATGKRSYATSEHGFYRNEPATIEGITYLFDENGEQVQQPGLFTLKRGDKSYTYDIQKDFSLKIGLEKIENTTTISNVLNEVDEKLWHAMSDAKVINIPNGAVPDKIEINMANLKQYLLKNFLSLEYNKKLEEANQVIKECNFWHGNLICLANQELEKKANLINSEENIYSQGNLLSNGMNGLYQIKLNHENLENAIFKDNGLLEKFTNQIIMIHKELVKNNAIKGQVTNYYFEPERKTGWLKIGDNWYFADSYGAIVSGVYDISHQEGIDVKKIDGTYLFDYNGKMKTNEFYHAGQNLYYFGKDGKAITDEIKSDQNGKNYYFNSKGIARKGDGLPHQYMIQNDELKALDDANNLVLSTPLVSLTEAKRKSQKTPDFLQEVGVDGVFMRLYNHFTTQNLNSIVHVKYRDGSSEGDIKPENNYGDFWNFEWHKLSLKYSHRYNQPVLIKFNTKDNSNCYLTIYTSRKSWGSKTVDMTIYASKTNSEPLISSNMWQKIYDLPEVGRNTDDVKLTKPYIIMDLKESGEIYKLDVKAGDENQRKFEEHGIDIGICSVK